MVLSPIAPTGATPSASTNDSSSADTKASSSSIPTPVVIRALRESDIPHLSGDAELPQDFFLRAVDRVDWSDKKLRVFVAELVETGELAGCVTVGLGYPDYFPQLDDSAIGQLYMSSISVKPAFQRRGIGLQLLQFVKEEAQQLNLDVFRAECEKGFRVDFYAKVGFEPVPYKGTHEAYPETHQMLELWLKKKECELDNHRDASLVSR